MPRIFTSSCLLNLEAFPWDHQLCYLRIGSWSFTMDRVDIFNASSSIILDEYYTQNGEWALVSYHVRKGFKFPNSTNPFACLVYTLELQRKAVYYVINFILPTGFVMLCTVMMFLVPPESGEKVSLSVTLLLSSTVLMMAIEDFLPVQSDTIPLLSKCCLWAYYEISVSVPTFMAWELGVQFTSAILKGIMQWNLPKACDMNVWKVWLYFKEDFVKNVKITLRWRKYIRVKKASRH